MQQGHSGVVLIAPSLSVAGMNRRLRTLIVATFLAFLLPGTCLLLVGNWRAASGALIPAGLLAPLLLEAWFPGEYALRKPEDGSPDTLFSRLKQFRCKHPGWDGFILAAMLIPLYVGSTASLLFHFVQRVRAQFSASYFCTSDFCFHVGWPQANAYGSGVAQGGPHQRQPTEIH